MATEVEAQMDPQNPGTTILAEWPKPRTYRQEVLARKGIEVSATEATRPSPWKPATT